MYLKKSSLYITMILSLVLVGSVVDIDSLFVHAINHSAYNNTSNHSLNIANITKQFNSFQNLTSVFR